MIERVSALEWPFFVEFGARLISFRMQDALSDQQKPER